MDTWIQSEGFHQYLNVKTNYLDIDGFELNMLLQYEGRGLLPLELQCQDGFITIRYDTGSSVPIAQRYDRLEMTGKEMRNLFQSIYACCEGLEDYFLPVEGILLQPERIYYQVGTKRYGFCYQPDSGVRFQTGFRTLVEFCMKHINHQDQDAILFLYGLYRFVQEGTVGKEEFRQYLDRNMTIDKEQAACPVPDSTPPVKKETPKASVIHPPFSVYMYGSLSLVSIVAVIVFGVRFFLVSHRERDLVIGIVFGIIAIVTAYSHMQCKKKSAIPFHDDLPSSDAHGNDRSKQSVSPDTLFQEPHRIVETIDHSESQADIGETTVLSPLKETEQDFWILEGQQELTGDIPLDHLPAVLGRKPEEVDHILSDEGISRRHLMLYQSGDNIYVEDLSSTNGTFINGERITEEQPHLLNEGDILTVGRNRYCLKKGRLKDGYHKTPVS